MELKQSKDICIDKLTSTTGVDLEIMSNLTSNNQIYSVMESLCYSYLGSKYVMARNETLLRLSVGWQARGREDLKSIGTVPEVAGWKDGDNPLGGMDAADR